MVKTVAQRSWGQRPGIGANIFPGLDPATFAASLEQFFQASGKVIDHWRQVSDELCEFSKSRLRNNMEVGHKVTRCGSVDEALVAQTDFARTMMQDYIAESGKLAEMSARAIIEGLSAWKALAPRVESEEATKHSMAAE
jgi:hypothetical protein